MNNYYHINYCLSEKVPEKCKVQYSLDLAIVVIFFNFVKAVVIGCVASMSNEAPMLIFRRCRCLHDERTRHNDGGEVSAFLKGFGDKVSCLPEVLSKTKSMDVGGLDSELDSLSNIVSPEPPTTHRLLLTQ